MTGSRATRVLAIDPSTRGFGFAILEGPDRLIDWGVKETRTHKKKRSLESVAHLIEAYQPGALVVEECATKGSRRCNRVVDLIDTISKIATKNNLKVRRFPRLSIKKAFLQTGVKNKYDIALAISRQFPELQPRLPRFRKPWMSEDYRMSIFDAVAMATICFQNKAMPPRN
jgi:Holliday junction resolvasome RuvABC endonuclease subunit